jgi:cyclase
MIQSLHRVLAQTDNQIKIVPGDGPVAPHADLQDYRDMLVKVRQRIQVLIAAGTTMDEAVAAAPTKDFDAQWGRSYVSPDVFVRMVFISQIDSGNANR